MSIIFISTKTNVDRMTRSGVAKDASNDGGREDDGATRTKAEEEEVEEVA